MNEYIVEFKVIENSVYKIKIDAESKEKAFDIIIEFLNGKVTANLKDINGNLIMIQNKYLISFEVHDIK